MKYIVAGAAVMVVLGLVGFASSNDLTPPASCTGTTPAVTNFHPR